MMGRILCLAALAAVAAAPVLAQQVLDARAAQRQLYNERRAELVVHPQPSVDPRLMAILSDRRQVAGFIDSVPYYGAIAVSPDQGMVEGAIVPVGNYHSFESASAAALGLCNAQKPRGAAPCVIVAEIRPKGWQARPFQLSAGATGVFRSEYRRARGDKAFAVSPSSGGYGVGKGAGAEAAAIAACNAAGSVRDCRAVLGD